jgi:hypothetical protein
MNSNDEMKKLVLRVVSLYESRVLSVGMIIDDSHRLLEDFRRQRNEMCEKLRNRLASIKSLRKKDFDSMMEDIQGNQDVQETSVKELLETFLKEQKELGAVLKNNLEKENEIKAEDFRNIIQEIQVRQEERLNEIRIALEHFQNDYQEMFKTLHNLLNRREMVKVRDIKSVLENIKLKQAERNKIVKDKIKKIKENYGINNLIDNIGENLEKNGVIAANSF